MSPTARILAAANTYCALTERRAHRPARSPERAAEKLTRAAKAGRLEGVQSRPSSDRYIQNIYTKINVSTRAGATLFAIENNPLA